MILQTERLILRPWQESDAEDLFRYASSPEVGPAAGWPAHTSVENSRAIIRDVLSAPETYAIIDKTTGRAIGSIGIKLGKASILDLPETEGEIGYWLGVPFWGNGLIPEATEEILRYGFMQLKLNKLWCAYYDGNIKSKRVQEKCGFVYQFTKENVPCPLLNETKTEHISCIAREDWLANQV